MRDNAALKKISEDQKHVALATTRDSAAMRVISLITVVLPDFCFLPLTGIVPFEVLSPIDRKSVV